MNAITTSTTFLPEKVEQREAWKMLQADFSDARNITPDRWRVLAAAFRSVPDDVLNTAVLAHLRDKPGIFPRVGDIYQRIREIQPPTPLQLHKEAMGRLGFQLMSDDGMVMVFAHRSDGHVVEWKH